MNEHRTEHFANLGHDFGSNIGEAIQDSVEHQFANFGQDFGSNLGKAIQESIEHQIDVLTTSDWFEEKVRDAVDDAFWKLSKEPEFESAVHQALNDWLNKVQSTVKLSLMDENDEKRKTRSKKREKLEEEK